MTPDDHPALIDHPKKNKSHHISPIANLDEEIPTMNAKDIFELQWKINNNNIFCIISYNIFIIYYVLIEYNIKITRNNIIFHLLNL